MTKSKLSTVLTISLIIILALFVGLQGASYFQHDGQSVSMASYIWFPTDHADTTAFIESQVSGYSINDIVGGVVLLQIAAVALIILLVMFSDNLGTMIGVGAFGLYGIINYASKAALRLGGGTQTMIIVLCALSVAAAAVSVVYHVREHRTEAARHKRVEEGEYAYNKGN